MKERKEERKEGDANRKQEGNLLRNPFASKLVSTVPPQQSTVFSYRHQNLVEVMELYKFQGKTVLILEYVQVSLKQVIAIPLDLKEVHVSTICGQVMVTYPSFE